MIGQEFRGQERIQQPVISRFAIQSLPLAGFEGIEIFRRDHAGIEQSAEEARASRFGKWCAALKESDRKSEKGRKQKYPRQKDSIRGRMRGFLCQSTPGTVGRSVGHHG